MDYSGFHNGRPCKACTSVEEMMRLGQKFIAQKEKDNANTSNGEQKTNNDGSSRTDNCKGEDLSRLKRTDCPIDKDLLGNSTWNLLHTVSVYYPEEPNQNQRNDMKNLLESLSKTYPCPPCAADFQKDLKTNPPKLGNRNEFANWMCEMHNRVNEKLGKEEFDCTRVMERWYDGWKDGSCDD